MLYRQMTLYLTIVGSAYLLSIAAAGWDARKGRKA